MNDYRHKVYIITGVSGSGKTTTGRLLAELLQCPFYDGDDFHPQTNIAKMSQGIPLDDADRLPWLKDINACIAKVLLESPLVVACSALRESYRNLLTKNIAQNQVFWIHLSGSFDVIYSRMKQRTAHFMTAEMLQSQFETYETPEYGVFVHVDDTTDNIMNQIVHHTEQSDLGLVGMGVMGVSLARNIAGKGYRLSLYNRHIPDKEEALAEKATRAHLELKQAKAFDSLEAFVQSLATPRKIWLMVQAGNAVDEVIETLIQWLSPGDIVIDGGNSHYRDTERRQTKLHSSGVHFLGTGVSGGEQGALHGPAIMVGGERGAFEAVRQLMEVTAAKNRIGEVCASYLGSGGAGHFVKMVHNGIEYGEMQLIADLVSHLRHDQGMPLNRISDLFREWNSGLAASYLLEITAEILIVRDVDGQPLVDKILDVAEGKGTGTWATIAASQLGVDVGIMTEALYARFLSAEKTQREAYADAYANLLPDSDKILINEGELLNMYIFCRIMNHHQGLQLIRKASEANGWHVDISEVLKVWTGGCIIRSALLEQFRAGLSMGVGDILLHSFTRDFIAAHYQQIKKTLSSLGASNQSYTLFNTAMNYFRRMTIGYGNASVIQAQRDCFGAHRYRRLDDDSGATHHMDWIPDKS